VIPIASQRIRANASRDCAHPEGFWSMIKRGVVGTFHKVGKKYMPLYVAEFQFRYNNRFNADIFGTAIEGC
jgi:ISXO2-like transposase domain